MKNKDLNKIKRNLPPLNALKTFESAARNLSFTKAARELNVTQGAVSRQIKFLEEYLKEPLFERLHQELVLTKKAKKYYNKISLALDEIEFSTNQLFERVKNNNIFIIDLLPSLGTHWIIPHIKYLKQKIPDLEVQVVSGGGTKIDFSKIIADVAIRVSEKKFKNVENIHLMSEEMILVCSPELDLSKIKTVTDITKYSFLDNVTRPKISKRWMKSVNINPNDFKEIIGFEHFFMLIEAAKQGMGFSLVPAFLVVDDLKNGQLVNPLEIHYQTGSYYYLLYPPESKTFYKLREFIKYFQETLPAFIR